MSDSLVEPSPPAAPPRPLELGREQGVSPQGTISDIGTGGGVPTGRAARFYMTSDLRAATGLTRTHLDFYLREGLVRPTARAESGYLLFDEAELATLRTVLRWRQDGIGLRQIRQRLGR
jgi:hypothetical protein